jgi:hypothetical protein
LVVSFGVIVDSDPILGWDVAFSGIDSFAVSCCLSMDIIFASFEFLTKRKSRLCVWQNRLDLEFTLLHMWYNHLEYQANLRSRGTGTAAAPFAFSGCIIFHQAG